MSADILAIGSVLWDVIGRTPRAMTRGADVPGRIERVPGGVAMNIAAPLAAAGWRVAMLTAIGRDAEGEDLIGRVAALGIDTAHVLRTDTPTDRYLAIEDCEGLVAALADAHSLEAAGAAILAPLADGQFGSEAEPWAGPVALDGNLTTNLLAQIAASPLFSKADLRIAPASPGKAERLAPFLGHPGTTLYLNRLEANLLSGVDDESAEHAALRLVEMGAERVLVTDGARRCADVRRSGKVFTAEPVPVPVKRITGAGDVFMAAHLSAELRGAGREGALHAALRAAATHVSGE